MGTAISDTDPHVGDIGDVKIPGSLEGAKGHVTVDNVVAHAFKSAPLPFETVAALIAVDPVATGIIDGAKAMVLGNDALGDCVPFVVEWAASSSATHDAYAVFRPSSGDASTGNGRWLRVAANPSAAFTGSDATPSIANGNYFVTAGSTPITDFDDAHENQLFTVRRGDADIVITHDDTKIDCGGANLILTAGRPTALFLHVNGVHRLLSVSQQPVRRVFRPEDYGAAADGAGASSEHVEVQGAITAAIAVGGTVRLSRKYRIGSQLDLGGSNYSVVGEGQHTGFSMIGSSQIAGLNFSGGIASAAFTLSGNVAARAGVLPLTSVSGLAAGDLLSITATLATWPRHFFCRIVEISSLNVYIDAPLPWALQTSDTYGIVKVTGLYEGVTLDNFDIDATDHTDATNCQGLYLRWTSKSRFTRLTTRGGLGAGCIAYYGHGCQFDVEAFGCGSAGTGAIQIVAHSKARIDHVRSNDGAGFGVLLTQIHNSRVGSAIGVNNNGRGVKFSYCRDVYCDFVQANANQYSGISLSDANTDIEIDNAEACLNQADGGVWMNGNGAQTCRINRLFASGNYQDCSIATGDKLEVQNARGIGSSNTFSALTRIKPEGGCFVHVRKTSSQTIAVAGSPVKVTFNSTPIKDNLGCWDGTNHRFVAKFPGRYLFSFGLGWVTADPITSYVRLRKNADDDTGFQAVSAADAAANTYPHHDAAFAIDLAKDDYVEVTVIHADGGGNAAVDGHNDRDHTYLQVTQIDPN